MLTPLQLQQRADARFADNEFQNITEKSFRDFAADLIQAFVAQAVANVPSYEPGRNYAPGFVIRHNFGGTWPVFLAALAPGGFLPAPISAAGDAYWELTLSPATGQELSQVGAVDVLRQLRGDWVPGRLYILVNRVDAQGAALPDVYVRALSAGALEPEGYALDPLPARVRYELTTDLTAPVVSASSFADLLGVPADNPALAAALAGRAYSAGAGISISSAHVISADQVPTYLEITSVNGLRIRELTVPGPLQIMDEVLDKNATAVRYQVDTNTRLGPRRYGTSNLSLLNVAQDLAALTPADYASGVKLSIYTVATSAPDDSMIALKLYSQYNLVLATSRLGNFPTDPGAPQSILTNSLFTQPFTGDEATGWQTSGGWSWDSVNLLALASNGQFLYQRNSTAMTVGGKYRVVVRLVDRPDGTPTSGSLSFANASGTLLVVPAGAAPGSYAVEFTASVASERLHLSGQAFTGAVAEFSVFRS